jgi:hypothetical protein
MTKPVCETENELAVSLGWLPIKDTRRHPASDCHWCKFIKGDKVVWNSYPVWIRGTDHGKCVTDQTTYATLEEALTGERRRVCAQRARRIHQWH